MQITIVFDDRRGGRFNRKRPAVGSAPRNLQRAAGETETARRRFNAAERRRRSGRQNPLPQKDAVHENIVRGSKRKKARTRFHKFAGTERRRNGKRSRCGDVERLGVVGAEVERFGQLFFRAFRDSDRRKRGIADRELENAAAVFRRGNGKRVRLSGVAPGGHERRRPCGGRRFGRALRGKNHIPGAGGDFAGQFQIHAVEYRRAAHGQRLAGGETQTAGRHRIADRKSDKSDGGRISRECHLSPVDDDKFRRCPCPLGKDKRSACNDDARDRRGISDECLHARAGKNQFTLYTVGVDHALRYGDIKIGIDDESASPCRQARQSGYKQISRRLSAKYSPVAAERADTVHADNLLRLDLAAFA